MFQLFGNAIGQVVAVSVLVGAGLPALFAFGIRALAAGEGGSAEVSGVAGKPAMKDLACRVRTRAGRDRRRTRHHRVVGVRL